MLQHGDPRASIGYVTVGLFSSAVLRELFAVLDSGGKLRKEEVLRSAVQALEDLESPGSAKGTEARLPFRGYEGAVTVSDALKQTGHGGPREVVELLRRVLTDPELEKGRAVREAIVFFRRLSQQATINSHVPQQDIPPGVRQLARSAPA